MADVSEEESDVELNTNEEQMDSKPVQQKYVNKPRELFMKAKKPKLGEFKEYEEEEEEEEEEENEDEKELESDEEGKEEEEYLDDEEYYKRLMAKAQEPEEEEEEDDFQRQLRLEREEQLRKQSEECKEEKKTRRDPDGTEYEWDPVVKGWFPKLPDQKYIEYQQQSYILTNPSLTSTSSSQMQYAKPLENVNYFFNGAFYTWDAKENKWQSITTPVYEYVDYMTGYKFEWSQEKNEWQNKGSVYGAPQAAQQQQRQQQSKGTTATTEADKDPTKKAWFDINDDKNTNVYVSGLPFDITDEEFEQMMSKYGIIMKDPITHKLKVKLYRDENNEVKGDGRCCYLMPESVKLCLQLLDGSDYKSHKIKVEKAKFEMKGTFDPSKAKDPTKRKLKQKEKKAIEKQRQKLLDWEERPEIVRGKHEKVVVIKNIFGSDDLKKDSSLTNKLKEELKTELESYGEVKKILVHSRSVEGVVTASFKDVEMADRCCEYLNNRVWKNGRIISCVTWDGKERFEQEETEEERQQRIDEWHRFLESDD